MRYHLSHRCRQRVLLFFAFSFAACLQSGVSGDGSLTDPSSAAYAAYLDFSSTLNYSHQKFMGKNDQVSIFWEVDVESEMLKLVVASACKGWVGFGISDAGGMKGADMVIFEASKKELNDYYSLDYIKPKLDDCPSDWSMSQNVVTESFIAFEASRPIDTKNNQDFRIFNDSDGLITPTNVIAAWGDSDALSFHGAGRAVRSTLRFYQPQYAKTEKSFKNEGGKSNIDILRESADSSVTFKANNFTVPLTNSHYEVFCINIEDIPGISTNESIHVIGLAHVPSIENNGVDTAGFVHHYNALGLPERCSTTLNPFKKVFYIWAPGQEPVVFPPQASFPLGGNSVHKALVLDVHYANLELKENVVDDTGIELFYVKEPRDFDAQVMVMGSAPGRYGIDGTPIPDGTSRHEMACPGACFSMHFENPVTVFAEGFHMHYNGVRATGQLIRDETEIVHEAGVEVWDYDQNGVRLVQQDPYQIIPGRDRYTHSCYYTTSNNDIIFGQRSVDEMCNAFLWYYPANENEWLGNYCGADFVIPDCSADYTSAIVDESAERVFGTHDGLCYNDSVQASCFPGSALVEVEQKGTTRLADVKLGDKVLVENGNFEPIYSFGHYAPSSKEGFIQLTTISRRELSLSAHHMVITINKGIIPALLVEIGDQLVDGQGESDSVVSISRTLRQGLFAPFTPSGKIVVNGIIASNYVALQNSKFFLIGSTVTPFTHQWLAHTFTAPFRFYCKYISHCTNEEYMEDGLSTWVATPFYAFSWMLRQHIVLLGICLIGVLVTLLPFSLIFDYLPACTTLIILLGAVLCYYFREKQWRKP